MLGLQQEIICTKRNLILVDNFFFVCWKGWYILLNRGELKKLRICEEMMFKIGLTLLGMKDLEWLNAHAPVPPKLLTRINIWDESRALWDLIWPTTPNKRSKTPSITNVLVCLFSYKSVPCPIFYIG